MSIKILKPSLQSSIQDLGRCGYGEFGIARSGAMDMISLRIANILLCNAQDEAAIELCYFGGEYLFLDSHYFVLSGADFNATLNDRPIRTCKVYYAQKGEKLILQEAHKGFRGYLAVAGGFDVPKVLGSKSSDTKSKIGLFGGRFLQKNDIIAAQEESLFFQKECENPIFSIPKNPKLRVVLGPNDDAFSKENINIFLNTIYTVGQNSNRMGISCESDNMITHKNGADIISDGIVFGSIQVPGSGQPIVLMADRQTTGGYTKIATVISSDITKLAQLRIGESFMFEEISIKDAYQKYLSLERYFKRLENKIMSIWDFDNPCLLLTR